MPRSIGSQFRPIGRTPSRISVLLRSLACVRPFGVYVHPVDSCKESYNTRIMESTTAVRALGSLAHDTRLAIYRLLVQAGQKGLAVGAIGEKLDVPPATLTFHLSSLRHAGLVSERRDGRTLYQVADYTAMNDLVGYLSENCCQGEDCGVVACAPAKPKQSSRTARKEPRHETPARTRRRR